MSIATLLPRLAIAFAIAGLAALTACDRPAPAPAPVEGGAPAEAPAGSPAPTDTPSEPPADSPAAPAQPTPDAPPPTDPSPAPTPTSYEPPLDSMQTAKPTAKLGVPVDLRYRFEAEPLGNQPVTLHLAAVPRVPGSNLAVSVKHVDGIEVAAGGAFDARKASANNAYRQQFSVTRQAASPPELRVLVTMDLPEGSAFGFYSIPLDAGTKSRKTDSVKPR